MAESNGRVNGGQNETPEAAGYNENRRLSRVSDIRVGMIFGARTSLPHIHTKECRQTRPYLAIMKMRNQVIALPLTTLKSERANGVIKTYKEICVDLKRTEWDYFPIFPNENAYGDSILPTKNSQSNTFSKGWIDLLTPMTIGTPNLSTSVLFDEISPSDLTKVITAHKKQMGSDNSGNYNGCFGACASVMGMTQQILAIAKELLQDSENKDLSVGKTERKLREIISTCSELATSTTPPHSPPLDKRIGSPEIQGEIEPLNSEEAPKKTRTRARGNTKSSGRSSCKEPRFGTRRTDDPNGRDGPGEGGPNGGASGGRGSAFPAKRNIQVGKGTSGGSNNSVQNRGSVQCADSNSAVEWGDDDWERIEYGGREDSETNSTEGTPIEAWQLLEVEPPYCNSESDSYFSSSEPESSDVHGLDVESWGPISSAASAFNEQSQMPKELLITRYLDGIDDSLAQNYLDKSLIPNEMPGTSPSQASLFISAESPSHDKKFISYKKLKRPQVVAALGVICSRCKQTLKPNSHGIESPVEASCNKCNINKIGNEDIRDKYRITSAFGESFDKLGLDSPRAGLANLYSGLLKRFLMQENLEERKPIVELRSESSPFRFVLREEHIKGQGVGEIGNCSVENHCQAVLEGVHDTDILCFLGGGYVDLSEGECQYNSTSQQFDTENPFQQVIGRKGPSSSFESERSSQNQVRQLVFPDVQSRCNYLLRLINPAQKALPPVHTLVKRFFEYVNSVREISRSSRWKGIDSLETFQCIILPKEYLPANSDILINLLRSYPLTEGDPDFQALARLSLTNDSDLLLERINLALPRSYDDWLATDDILNGESVQSTPGGRFLLQLDGMFKWIRFVTSTLGLREIHVGENSEEEGSSKIEKDLRWFLDGLRPDPALTVESGTEEGDVKKGRIHPMGDLKENTLEARGKKLKLENEWCQCYVNEGGDRCGSDCVNKGPFRNGVQTG